MVTRPADGIPVGLSIVLYLVSNVRNTLVILTPVLIDAADLGAAAHRVRLFWTNMMQPAQLQATLPTMTKGEWNARRGPGLQYGVQQMGGAGCGGEGNAPGI